MEILVVTNLRNFTFTTDIITLANRGGKGKSLLSQAKNNLQDKEQIIKIYAV